MCWWRRSTTYWSGCRGLSWRMYKDIKIDTQHMPISYPSLPNSMSTPIQWRNDFKSNTVNNDQ
jgi:hypothetical protein